MPSDKTASAKTSPDALPFAFDAGWMKAMPDASMRLYDGFLCFTAKRLRAQADYMQSLAKCQSSSDILENQAAFLRGAMEDYLAEAAKSTKLMQDASGMAPGA